MATFSVNQARHFYVAKSVKDSELVSADPVGTIFVKSDNNKSHVYFQYIGAGGQVRSDLIDIDKILYARTIDADNMAHNLVKYKVTLGANINAGNPVSGQDYILRISFNNYIGLSEQDQYFKYGAVYAMAGMTASDFYKKMAISLVKNFSREENKLLRFYLETGGNNPAQVTGTPVEITMNTKESTLNDTYTGLVIEEAPQEWSLGTFQQESLNFDIQPSTVTSNGSEVIWGNAIKVKSTNKVDNGKKIADMEYFYMGERGDVYRGMGYPNNIKTVYLVDPSLKYNIIDIHYYYTGSNESMQKSEKTLTLAIPKIGDNNAASNVLANDLIDKINTATGLKIAKLSV